VNYGERDMHFGGVWFPGINCKSLNFI
jgi:hypothetical protein